jgi:hypothetical protein
VDRAVAAQKKVLENTVAQTKAAMEAARQHIDLAESPADAALSSFQKGVDKLVETQKQMMDLVTH